MDIEWDIIVRLIVAAALGAAIGIEREATDQPAGLRTHIAVALGAALFGVISTTGFSEFEATRASTNIQIDVTRVASLVASGIGFIGAGLIFRQGTTVRNLTTAASVWVAAAVGLSCGVGNFAPAIATTVVALTTLALLRIPKAWIRRYIHPTREDVRVVLVAGVGDHVMRDAFGSIVDFHLEYITLEKERGAFVLSGRAYATHGHDVRTLLAPIARMDIVDSLTCGDRTLE